MTPCSYLSGLGHPLGPPARVVSDDAPVPTGASLRPQALLTVSSGRTHVPGEECVPGARSRPASSFPRLDPVEIVRSCHPPAFTADTSSHCDVRRIGADIPLARLTVRGRRGHASCSGLALGGAGMRWFMAWCVPDRALQVRAGRAISPSQEAAASPSLRLAPGFVQTVGTPGRSPAPPQGR